MKKKLLALLLVAASAISMTAIGCNTNDSGSHTQHNFVNYVSDNNATCTTDGTETAKCTGCDKTDTRTVAGSKLNHNFVNYVSDNNATCQKDGTKTAHCSRTGCTATDTITDAGTKLNHKFENYVSDGNATCTADGTKTAICSNDGCTEKDTVADVGSKLAHNFVDGKCETCQAPDPDYNISDAKVIELLEANCMDEILDTISPWVTLDKKNIVEKSWYLTKDPNKRILTAECFFKYLISKTEPYFRVVKIEFNEALTENNVNFENIKTCENAYISSTYLSTIQDDYKPLTNAICDKLFGQADENTQRFIVQTGASTELGGAQGFKVIEIRENSIRESETQIKVASSIEEYATNFNNGFYTSPYANKRYEISGEKVIAEE